MFRSQQLCLYWKATKELAPATAALHDRRKYERSLGTKFLLKGLILQSRHRHENKRPWERSIARTGINAVANENGNDWQSLSKDIARQNIVINQRCMHRIAQFEPLAFRCLLELSSSAIPPPPNVSDPTVQAELKQLHKQNGDVNEQLRVDIARLLKPKSALKGSGRRSLGQEGADDAAVIEGWADSWKEFDVAKK
jgi:ribosomal protein L20